MNDVTLTRHLLAKDLRHQRAWVALVWGFALLLPALARMADSNMTSVMPLVSGAFFLLAIVTLGQLVQLDAPGRKLNFLATRPVPWNVLLAEKILFAVAFLLVPVWVAKMGILWLLGIPTPPAGVALLLIENTIHTGALMAGVALFACFFRNLWIVLLVIIAAGLAILLFGAYFLMRSAYQGESGADGAPAGIADSRSLAFFVLFILLAGATIVLRFRYKTIFKPLCILVVGLALWIAVGRFWPWDLGRLIHGGQSREELPAAVHDAIHFSLKDTRESSTGGSFNGVSHVTVQKEFDVTGVEPPYFISPAGYRSVATLKSGKTIRSEYDSENRSTGLMRWRAPVTSDYMLQRAAGFKPASDGRSWNPGMADVFDYTPSNYHGEDMAGATITGTLIFEVRKIYVVKTSPFADGTTAGIPGRSYRLGNVRFDLYGARFEMAENSMAPALGGYATGPGWQEISVLVFNRARNEFLVSDGSGSTGATALLYEAVSFHQELRPDSNATKGTPTLPEDWAKGAEISFFNSEKCGRISFPFEIRNVNLER